MCRRRGIRTGQTVGGRRGVLRSCLRGVEKGHRRGGGGFTLDVENLPGYILSITAKDDSANAIGLFWETLRKDESNNDLWVCHGLQGKHALEDTRVSGDTTEIYTSVDNKVYFSVGSNRYGTLVKKNKDDWRGIDRSLSVENLKYNQKPDPQYIFTVRVTTIIHPISITYEFNKDTTNYIVVCPLKHADHINMWSNVQTNQCNSHETSLIELHAEYCHPADDDSVSIVWVNESLTKTGYIANDDYLDTTIKNLSTVLTRMTQSETTPSPQPIIALPLISCKQKQNESVPKNIVQYLVQYVQLIDTYLAKYTVHLGLPKMYIPYYENMFKGSIHRNYESILK